MTALDRGVIVFVVPDFEPTIGGTTRQTATQARALLARGYDAIVLTQRADRSWPRDERRDGLRVVRLGPSRRGPVAMKLLDAHVAWWLRRHRDAIAIVHVVMYPDFALAAVAAGCGSRTVMAWAGLGDATDTLARNSPEGREPQASAGGRARSSLVRAALRAGRRCAFRRAGVTHVALTGAIADEVVAATGGSRPDVIPTPVDVDRYRPARPDERAAARRDLDLGPDDVAVVYAGHLRALKRVDRLIDAAAILRDQGLPVRMFLLGDSRAELDDTTDALRRQVAGAGLDDSVRFTGAVADTRPYLWAADVFVLPSEREGLSNALLEALASGVPCVAPASAGGTEVFGAASSQAPESGEPAALASAIAAAADRHGWSERSEAARARALRYSSTAVTGEYERLYARIGVAGFESRRRLTRR